MENKENIYESEISSYKAITESSRVQSHILNPHVLTTIGDVKGKNVLDIGCGYGKFLKIFEGKSANVLMGLDISEDQILKASDYLDQGTKLLTGDAADPNIINKIDCQFDIIYSTFCLNFMSEENKVRSYFTNMFKLLKSGGNIFILQQDEKVLGSSEEIMNVAGMKIELLSGNWAGGAKIRGNIGGKLEIYSHYWNFEHVEPVLSSIGFTNIRKIPIYLKSIALEQFSQREWDLLSESEVYYIISASKS